MRGLERLPAEVAGDGLPEARAPGDVLVLAAQGMGEQRLRRLDLGVAFVEFVELASREFPPGLCRRAPWAHELADLAQGETDVGEEADHGHDVDRRGPVVAAVRDAPGRHKQAELFVVAEGGDGDTCPPGKLTDGEELCGSHLTSSVLEVVHSWKPCGFTYTRATLILVASDSRNITLALPKTLLRRLKVVAAERDTSISALMRQLLEEFLSRQDDYGRAWEHEVEIMRSGLDLGTHGAITWSRDELHER